MPINDYTYMYINGLLEFLNGGFTNFAGHEFAWFEALDFRRERRRLRDYLGASYCPPYVADMAQAVQAVVERKFGPQGVLAHGIEASAFKASARVGRAMTRPSPRVVDATIAYCSYVIERYGRFPAYPALQRGLPGGPPRPRFPSSALSSRRAQSDSTVPRRAMARTRSLLSPEAIRSADVLSWLTLVLNAESLSVYLV